MTAPPKQKPNRQSSGRRPIPKRKILIVAPHFPPSNLAGVHRSRLFAQHLPEFGWDPIILTVAPEHYEEQLDYALSTLIQPDLRIETVGALPTRPVRIVGDIGLRGFVPMLRRILQIVDRENIEFLYIPVPSFYAAVLGRIVLRLRGTPYGIDYIDPWVHPPTGRENFKGRLALFVARLLEPIAVKNAVLITGVAESYYAAVLDRNPRLKQKAVTSAMPYGGESRDHEQVRLLGLCPSLFPPHSGRFRLVYAGAMLPRAYTPLERMCAALAHDRELGSQVEFFFIGTGKTPNDPSAYNIRPIAERYGLWAEVIHEHPARIPYLETLAHLEASDGVFVLGSTEPHYTPSKVYQGVLSRKPVLAVLHKNSTASRVLQQTAAGLVLNFDGEADTMKIESFFAATLREFMSFAKSFDASRVNLDVFEQYSAQRVTANLAEALNRALDRGATRTDT